MGDEYGGHGVVAIPTGEIDEVEESHRDEAGGHHEDQGDDHGDDGALGQTRAAQDIRILLLGSTGLGLPPLGCDGRDGTPPAAAIVQPGSHGSADLLLRVHSFQNVGDLFHCLLQIALHLLGHRRQMFQGRDGLYEDFCLVDREEVAHLDDGLRDDLPDLLGHEAVSSPRRQAHPLREFFLIAELEYLQFPQLVVSPLQSLLHLLRVDILTSLVAELSYLKSIP